MASNYPPGVTGNEYAIGGAEREWVADATCPRCDWTGPMTHEQHREFGIRAFCENPERIELSRNEHGWTEGPCPLVKEGFEIEPEEEME